MRMPSFSRLIAANLQVGCGPRKGSLPSINGFTRFCRGARNISSKVYRRKSIIKMPANVYLRVSIIYGLRNLPKMLLQMKAETHWNVKELPCVMSLFSNSESSGNPEPHNHRNAYEENYTVKREPDAPIVAELIPARGHDQRIGLVSNWGQIR